MIWRTVQGALTLGDLVLAYQAFQQGQGLIRALLGSVNQLYAAVLFLGSLFDFLTLRPEVVSPAVPAPLPVPLRTGIRFEGVTFRYPRSDRTTLADLDLEIPAGRIVAILGANGAGKSTLVKLLCRFYDPQAGRITVDGIDLRHVDVDMLRRSISAVFQAPIRYAATAAENIAFGDVEQPMSASRITAAAVAAGAHETIQRLPEGYATKLGTLFAGGTDLSVGEWQRIALARAVLREAPIWLLDEPTSATDSWAEAEWLDRLRALAQGRTTLIITHRLSTAVRADVIHVMADGRIVESGTHDELLARHGQYAASWAAQRQG
jgi:ATP-binding cassette subfamily B protein